MRVVFQATLGTSSPNNRSRGHAIYHIPASSFSYRSLCLFLCMSVCANTSYMFACVSVRLWLSNCPVYECLRQHQ